MVQKFPHKYLTKLISNDYNISTIDQNIKSQKIFLSSLSKKFQNQIKIRYCFSNNFFQMYTIMKKNIGQTSKIGLNLSLAAHQ